MYVSSQSIIAKLATLFLSEACCHAEHKQSITTMIFGVMLPGKRSMHGFIRPCKFLHQAVNEAKHAIDDKANSVLVHWVFGSVKPVPS